MYSFQNTNYGMYNLILIPHDSDSMFYGLTRVKFTPKVKCTGYIIKVILCYLLYTHTVVVGNRRTVMNIGGNPAYDSTHKRESDENQTLSSEITTCATEEDRGQLEHTYESISNCYIQDMN